MNYLNYEFSVEQGDSLWDLFDLLNEINYFCYKKNGCLKIDLYKTKILFKVQRTVIKKKFVNCISEKTKKYSIFEYFKILLNSFINYCVLKKIDKMNFDDIHMSRYLLAILHLLSLECVVIIDSDTMENLALEKYSNKYCINNYNLKQIPEEQLKTTFPVIRKIESMGIYFKHLPVSYLLKTKELYNLYSIFKKYELNDEVSKIDNIIFICPDNQKFFLKKLSASERKVLTQYRLSELVFSHEIGHLIFSDIETISREIQEKQANLVSSFLYSGLYDYEISLKTSYQLEEYHNPILFSDIKDYKSFQLKYGKLYDNGE